MKTQKIQHPTPLSPKEFVFGPIQLMLQCVYWLSRIKPSLIGEQNFIPNYDPHLFLPNTPFQELRYLLT